MLSHDRWAAAALTLLAYTWVACTAYAATSAAPATAARNGYDYYQIGNLQAPRPAPTEAALMLKGGGEWNHDAFAWLVAKAGHGHFVVLRASYADDIQNSLYHEIGGVASVQTLVFHSRAAASDPAVLDIIRHADGIFIAGGDQANYVRFWRGTPLSKLLDEHVAQGKPLGGTSAGLAILGAYAYGALDGGSISSADALADPLGASVTLVGGFLHLPYLQHVITDSHFAARDRLGRLLAFVARLRYEGRGEVIGLGIDEGTSLCVDANGVGRVFTVDHGLAWLVQPVSNPRLAPGKPLQELGVHITGIDTQSRIDMHDFSVQRPAFSKIADVHEGKMVLRDGTAPPPPKPATALARSDGSRPHAHGPARK